MSTNALAKEHKQNNQLNDLTFEDVGDDHLFTGLETPMKPDAFLISDEEKKRKNSYIVQRNNGCYRIRPYR